MTGSRLLAFYRGGPDDRGRTLAAILAWDDDLLEWTHDYIQWVFPLRERSMARSLAPVLSPAEVEAFRRDPALQQRMLDAVERMRRFYGFGHGLGQDDARPWLSPGNHNFLRLTRILRSLRTVGLDAAARALFDDLTAVYDTHATIIGRRTYDYWCKAMTDDFDN
jgi:hypothetical protein